MGRHARADHGHDLAGSGAGATGGESMVVVTDGIVFILVENRRAGQGSLGKGRFAPRAFWHVQGRSENHGRRLRATAGASEGDRRVGGRDGWMVRNGWMDGWMSDASRHHRASGRAGGTGTVDRGRSRDRRTETDERRRSQDQGRGQGQGQEQAGEFGLGGAGAGEEC